MKKKTIVVENETQKKILEHALEFERTTRQFGISKNDQSQRKEKLIHEITEIEKLEKQLEE